MKKMTTFLLILLVVFAGCQQPLHYSEDETGNNESLRIQNEKSLGVMAGTKPFPQTMTTPNIVRPSNRTQDELNNDVLKFYDHWKKKYLRKSTIIKDGNKSAYYVLADYTGPLPKSWIAQNVKPKSHSEATGYGMIISAFMNEQEVFDGLYIMYNSYRSTGNPELMSWIIPDNESLTLEKTNSATDGDIDIAYGLLLAHEQWGSNGTYNYKAQALKVIEAIKKSDFNAVTKRTNRGDWDTGDASTKYSTRSSDWIVAEFRTFYEVTKDRFWLEAINEIYIMIDEVIATDSPVTHLMPDFVEGDPAKKATPPFLEKVTDDDYSWNACRYPWRVGMDYGLFGEIKSKNALDGLVAWALAKCNNDPWQYMAGYTLAGDFLINPDTGTLIDYSNNAFYSPLAVAASHDSKNQLYINNAWEKMATPRDWNSFFGDTITMQCMIYLSGNWWIPKFNPSNDTEPPKPVNDTFKKVSESASGYSHSWTPFTDNVGVVRYDVYQDGVFAGSSPTADFKHTGLNAKTRYTVNVYAFDKAGNKSIGISTAIWLGAADTQAPSVPKNIKGTIDANQDLVLTWDKSTDNFTNPVHYIVVIKELNNGYNKTVETNGHTVDLQGLKDSYTVALHSIDQAGNKSVLSEYVVIKTGGSGIPKDPAATGAPSSFTLSKNKWNGESTYKVTADMWWGNNATQVTLYENGVLVKTVNPSFASPSAQKIVFDFSGKPKGTYLYKLEAVNQYGTTTSNLTIAVTQ